MCLPAWGKTSLRSTGKAASLVQRAQLRRCMHHAQLGAAFRCFPKPAEIYCQHTPSNLLGGSLLDGSCPQLAKNSIGQLAYWHDGLQRAHGGSKHIQAAAEHCDQNAHDMHHLSIIVSCVAYRVTLFAVGIVATVSPLKMNTGHLEILLASPYRRNQAYTFRVASTLHLRNI